MAENGIQDHRLLIMGSMDEFVELVEKARERDIYTIVCDGYADGPAKSAADASYLVDIDDAEAIAGICREERADGIIASFSDILAECMVDAADAAGLDTYLTPAQMRHLRDKTLMKRMFNELGIRIPVHREFMAGEIPGILTDIEFPLVIKPVAGYGSHGVFVARDIEDLDRGIRENDIGPDTCLIAEEYFDGPEFNIMTWIVDGEAHVLSVADRQKAWFDPNEVPQVVRIVYPSIHTEAVLEEAQDISARIASYLGMRYGPLCIQAFLSPEGALIVCEAAGRIFGYEHELLAMTSDITVEDLLLDSVYDPESMSEGVRSHSPRLAGCAAGIYLHGRNGTVSDTGSLDRLAEIDGVVDYLPYYRVGDTIGHGKGAKPYAARYYIKGHDRETVDAISSSILDHASVRGVTGEELLKKALLEDLG